MFPIPGWLVDNVPNRSQRSAHAVHAHIKVPTATPSPHVGAGRKIQTTHVIPKPTVPSVLRLPTASTPPCILRLQIFSFEGVMHTPEVSFEGVIRTRKKWSLDRKRFARPSRPARCYLDDRGRGPALMTIFRRAAGVGKRSRGQGLVCSYIVHSVRAWVSGY